MGCARTGAAILLVLLAACRSADRPTSRPLPSVLLVVLDTVRAENLGVYGYERDTSPALDSLATRATLFRRAISTSNWTHPSHISILTGRFTFEHGGRYLAPPRRDARGRASLAGLNPGHKLLAEMFQSLGYDTAAFVANRPHLDPERLPGIERGFDTYVVANAPPGRVLSRTVLSWLSREAEPAPFFVFLNYMDAHQPYNTTPVAAWVAEQVPRDRRPGSRLEQVRDRVMGGEARSERTRRLIEEVTLQYDAGIRNADAALSKVLGGLERLGLFDDTLIVVTSDHGEFLGEHGLVAHGIHLYEPGIRIPLIVKFPGQQAGAVDDRWVTLADIPGLILSSLPEEVAEPWREHFRYEPGSHPVMSEQYYASMARISDAAEYRRVLRTLVEWPFKLIHSSDGAHELYDLQADPGESRNLITERPELAERMQTTLTGFLRQSEYVDQGAWPSNPSVPDLDPRTRDQLEALGYL